MPKKKSKVKRVKGTYHGTAFTGVINTMYTTDKAWAIDLDQPTVFVIPGITSAWQHGQCRSDNPGEQHFVWLYKAHQQFWTLEEI